MAMKTISATGIEPVMNGNKNQGFTLLELIIVVFVMTLVLAASYPSLTRGSTALHLRSTSRDILNVFRHARDKAVTEQIRMKVTVDLNKQELLLSDTLGKKVRKYSLPKDVRIQRIALAGGEILEGPLIIRFLPNGSSDNAEVLLRSDTGSVLRIISDPITGGARIESGRGESFP
jgi:prepilin-type N-terminal cleavage/methylation domain-containing protein